MKHSFKKVRVNNNKASESQKLYNKMRELKGKVDQESKDEISKVVEGIAAEAERK